MRSFLERALERNPALRSSAAELLKDEAINPPREDQPRCWSLDSALEEVTHTMMRQQSQHHDITQGKDLGTELSLFPLTDNMMHIFNTSLFRRIFSLLGRLWSHEEKGLLVHWPRGLVRLLQTGNWTPHVGIWLTPNHKAFVICLCDLKRMEANCLFDFSKLRLSELQAAWGWHGKTVLQFCRTVIVD